MRLIDADALIKKLDEQIQMPTFMDCLSAINSAPSIDIVRCRECKYWDDTIPNEIYCSLLEGLCDISGDSFCSYGEREGE